MEFQSYNNFWQRMHKSAKVKGFPLRVMFELTYRCNFYCRHCYVPFSYRRYKELKTEEVFSILDQLADVGCFYLGFTGGEPFMRKDIMDILMYAKKKGFEVIIYTNGSLINKKKAEELVNLRPNKIDITIPAMSKAAFERISGVGGSRDRVFRTVDFLHKRGVNLGFKTCVLKENEAEIGQIQRFAESLGALHRLDDTLSASLDGSREPYKYRGVFRNCEATEPRSRRGSEQRAVFAKSEIALSDVCDSPLAMTKVEKSAMTKVEKLTRPKAERLARTKAGKPAGTNATLFRCGVGVSQVAITPGGELKMCLMFDYPKYRILEDRGRRPDSNGQRRCVNLEGAWEKLKVLVSEIRPDANYNCHKCELGPYCKWCPARSWLYNGSFTSCEPESRRKAELVREFL